MSVHAEETPVSDDHAVFSQVISDITARRYGTTLQQSTDQDPLFQSYQSAIDAVLQIRSIINRQEMRRSVSPLGEFQQPLILYPVNFSKED
jgi:hypothetical protein